MSFLDILRGVKKVSNATKFVRFTPLGFLEGLAVDGVIDVLEKISTKTVKNEVKKLPVPVNVKKNLPVPIKIERKIPSLKVKKRKLPIKINNKKNVDYSSLSSLSPLFLEMLLQNSDDLNSKDFLSVFQNLSNSVSVDSLGQYEGSSLLDILQSNNKALVNVVSNGFSKIVAVLGVIATAIAGNDVNKLTAVLGAGLGEISNSLNVVSEAKVLEKENYEYMKTPQTYTLSDEALPNLSPREVIALSEAIKAHLNSQEASITGEELEDFENDFDLGDVLVQLFKFKGITEDINKLPKE